MTDSLQVKTALITGGCGGIGRSIGLELASRGVSVVIGYLSNDARASTITWESGKAAAVRANLSRLNEATRLFDEAEQTFGALDIVVANAALASPHFDHLQGWNSKGRACVRVNSKS